MSKKIDLKLSKLLRLLVIGISCLIVLFSSNIFFKQPAAHAGWSSALILVWNPGGGCYLEDVYVWVNGYEICI